MKNCPMSYNRPGVTFQCDRKQCEWWDEDECIVNAIKGYLKDIRNELMKMNNNK